MKVNITVPLDRDAVERIARRTLTDHEFDMVKHEVGVYLKAELRMVTSLVITELGYADALTAEQTD